MRSDTPIREKSEDKFNRAPLAERIADSIIQRSDDENLVLGIYGSWGSGKTSLLQIIEKELERDLSIIPIYFNPWKFDDYKDLLVIFFNEIAISLNKRLDTTVEQIGKKVKKYGSLGKILGFDFTELGKNISHREIEESKKRVEKILLETEFRLVIFIDDIDRLDKSEIFYLFKVLKLTFNFQKTIYVLSFDRDMVAEAIGERYGVGNKEAGINFLEKIIHVPIQLPKPQEELLKDFCYPRIEKILIQNNLSLTDEERDRFSDIFLFNAFKLLNTPRLIVRFTNTISFSLSLIKE